MAKYFGKIYLTNFYPQIYWHRIIKLHPGKLNRKVSMAIANIHGLLLD